MDRLLKFEMCTRVEAGALPFLVGQYSYQSQRQHLLFWSIFMERQVQVRCSLQKMPLIIKVISLSLSLSSSFF